VQVTDKQPLRFIYHAAPPFREGITWGGPIVMNTQKELRQGTFLKN
jgi:redox-sensitive bicupin YhaK (pirin superfamily)